MRKYLKKQNHHGRILNVFVSSNFECKNMIYFSEHKGSTPGGF